MALTKQLPIPKFFAPQKVGSIWQVPYQQRAVDARNWSIEREIMPPAKDLTRICLLLIDVQNTFCIPGFELFVGGHSGMGAVEDNVRLCQFIYRNLNAITQIVASMDTHSAMQIFHPLFWINDAGENPLPGATTIELEDLQQGVWKVNPAVAYSLAEENHSALQQYALHYANKLTENGKYPLTIWPYHAMLGGIGHALVSAVEEALFFHNIARHSQTHFELKGNNPLTENYSVLRAEVLEDDRGKPIARKNDRLLEKLLSFDAAIVAGQAKSHCVLWTIDDLMTEILNRDPHLAKKIYLLEDCTSPVVVPGVVDFSIRANEAFERFADYGMHLVKSTETEWLQKLCHQNGSSTS